MDWYRLALAEQQGEAQRQDRYNFAAMEAQQQQAASEQAQQQRIAYFDHVQYAEAEATQKEKQRQLRALQKAVERGTIRPEDYQNFATQIEMGMPEEVAAAAERDRQRTAPLWERIPADAEDNPFPGYAMRRGINERGVPHFTADDPQAWAEGHPLYAPGANRETDAPIGYWDVNGEAHSFSDLLPQTKEAPARTPQDIATDVRKARPALPATDLDLYEQHDPAEGGPAAQHLQAGIELDQVNEELKTVRVERRKAALKDQASRVTGREAGEPFNEEFATAPLYDEQIAELEAKKRQLEQQRGLLEYQMRTGGMPPDQVDDFGVPAHAGHYGYGTGAAELGTPNLGTVAPADLTDKQVHDYYEADAAPSPMGGVPAGEGEVLPEIGGAAESPSEDATVWKFGHEYLAEQQQLVDENLQPTKHLSGAWRTLNADPEKAALVARAKGRQAAALRLKSGTGDDLSDFLKWVDDLRHTALVEVRGTPKREALKQIPGYQRGQGTAWLNAAEEVAAGAEEFLTDYIPARLNALLQGEPVAWGDLKTFTEKAIERGAALPPGLGPKYRDRLMEAEDELSVKDFNQHAQLLDKLLEQAAEDAAVEQVLTGV